MVHPVIVNTCKDRQDIYDQLDIEIEPERAPSYHEHGILQHDTAILLEIFKNLSLWSINVGKRQRGTWFKGME